MTTSHDEALIFAAAAGDLPTVVQCLDAGADPNAEIGDRANEAAKSPLGEAVRYGHTDVVMTLIDRGAPFDENAAGGFDVVTGALLAGHLRLADRLYERGARARLLIGLCFAGNVAAIHEILHREPQRWEEYFLDAVRCGSLEMVEENIERNPDPEQIHRASLLFSAIFQWRLVHWFPRKIDGVDDGFDRANYQRILKRLLDWGMDPNMRSDSGSTPLHNCA